MKLHFKAKWSQENWDKLPFFIEVLLCIMIVVCHPEADIVDL